MRGLLNYLGVFVLILGLILIRTFEKRLFYDPYLHFFENDYLYQNAPQTEVVKLTFYTILRYFMNGSLSLGILFLVFRDWPIVKFSFWFYALAFTVLIPLFLYFVIYPCQTDYFIFFTVRRFLIHPLWLILLLPAFYYKKLKDR